MNTRNHIIIVALSTCILASCSGNHPVDLTGAEATKTARGKPQFAQVTERSLSGTVRLPGQLKPFEEVSIYAKVNGFVKSVYVDRGTVVRKGQVLARLEAPEMQGQVQTATSKYVQAQESATASREKYQRLKEAAKEPGAVAQLELDNALARMRADEAAVQSEKSSLSSVSSVSDYLTITAPFDGIIVQRNVSPGALAGSGKSGDQPLFVLQQASRLRLEVMIPEAYVDKVDLAHTLDYTFNAIPGQVFHGSISRSAAALGNMRSMAIEIDVPNVQRALKAGMYAEVKIPLLSDTKTLIVPASAIVRSTERMYVVVADGGKAHLVDVKEGMKTGDSTEVFGGLRSGQAVLLHATDEVKEGASL
jgi:membrane fusion protein (multidrug efflux system)